jgi:7-carboxy-7-deazaguanine synthase
MLNMQPPEKRVRESHGLLSVHSIFHTIQGEGPFCGTPAVFVRLAGCNLQCPLCDTDYTTSRKNMYAEEIGDAVDKAAGDSKTRLVVITGGEPFRQDLKQLLVYLTQGKGYYVQVETNGTLAPPEIVYSQDIGFRFGVYIVCSPKAGAVHKRIHEEACCYKYVGNHGNLSSADGLPIFPLQNHSYPMVARPRNNKIPIYLQPTDHKDPRENELALQAVIKSCMKHGYILQLQIHKIINME